MAAKNRADGTLELTLTEPQAREIIKDLTFLLPYKTSKEPTQMAQFKARTFFYDSEGYMASDDACLKYWEEHYEES